MNLDETDNLLQIADLIAAYHEGTLSAQQQAGLDAILIDNAVLRNMIDSFSEKNKVLADLKVMNGFDTELSLVEFRKKQTTPKNFKLWPRMAIAAAAAVATIVFGVWLYTSRLHINRNSEIASQNNITPGKNTATLTLPNGKTITLSDAKTGVVIGYTKLSYNDGTAIGAPGNGKLDLADGQVQTITTPRGGTYQIILSEGTVVTLNADSKLTYPATFTGGERRVKMEGEGEFKVAKNKKLPFIVETAGQTVQVLGTHFNINAYKDEGKTVTTLLEGSVRVRHSELVSASRNRKSDIQSNDVILIPNQQSTLNNNALSVGVADPGATAWVKGKFQFNNTSLSEVMRQISRWYDVEIVYPEGIPNERFTGGINRNLNVSEVLGMLEMMHVKFKIEGKKIIVGR